MKIYYVDRVIIKSMNPDGTFRAISKTGGPPFDRCYFVWGNPNNASQEQLGKSALLLSIDNQNFILGYYVDDNEMAEYKLFLEGEQLLRAGESKAISLGDDGVIGIYDIVRNSDGTITKTPKLVYEADEKLYASFSEMLITMSDASVSTEINEDSMGFKSKMSVFKGRGDDAGPRIVEWEKGVVSGVEKGISIDLGAGPKRTIPAVDIDKLPMSFTATSGYELPLSMIFAMASIPNTKISISKKGRVDIQTGFALAGPSLYLNPEGNDSVVIKNLATGTGKVTITKQGTAVISGMSGAELEGASVGLVATLIAFMGDYMGHIHPSSSGPTGPPKPPAGVKAKTALNKIKGNA